MWAQLAGMAVGGWADRKAKKEQKRAANRANAYEADRTQRADASTALIDQAFDSKSRQQQYGRYADALRGYLGEQLGRRKEVAGRKRKFAVAKAGQTGGSLDYSTERRLGDEFADAALQNERTVQRGVYDLQDADQRAREGLIRLARSGTSLTSLVGQKNAMMQANLADATAAGRAQGLGDVFASTFDTYRNIQERGERRRGFGYDANRQDIYGGTG